MKIAALIDDLFFTSKVAATARQVGSEVVFCNSADSVPEDAERICVDLNAMSFDAVAEIAKLRTTHKAPIVAYLSHVQLALKLKAEEAGAQVMPRSQFTMQLSEILK